MAKNKSGNGKSMVKNTGDFHPDESNMKQWQAQPQGAVPTGMSVVDEPWELFQDATLDELRQRAKALALRGADDMERKELIEALQQYKSTVLDRRPTFEQPRPS